MCGVVVLLASLKKLILIPVMRAAVVGALSAGCGVATTTTPDIVVEIVGVFETPPNAKGTITPQSQVYTIDAVNIIKSNGDAIKLLTESKSIKVVNRRQLVISSPLADYKGSSFSRASITLNAAVATNTRSSQDLVSALTSLTYDSDTNFTVESTSSVKLSIKVKWGNLVTKNADTGVETVGAPDFVFTVE